jgi:asparagine synthase (glutamine-hydrolysing)
MTESHFLTTDTAAVPVAIGFTRLHIQGSRTGVEQPFKMSDGRHIVCNGEIFNAEILVRQLGLRVPTGASDCAVIPAMAEQHIFSLTDIARQLDGDFAIVDIDTKHGTVTVTRDPYGVRPLYYGAGNGWQAIISERKGFPADTHTVRVITPGTTVTFAIDEPNLDPATDAWHQPPWLKIPYWRSSLEALTHGGMALRHALEEAVVKRLATVREVGVYLTGDIESALVAAIAARALKARGKQLHTYSVGTATQLAHIRTLATILDSQHEELIVGLEDTAAIIPAVVRAIETADVKTVRAAVYTYMVGRLISEKTPNVKVLLNGVGANEVLGGYSYLRDISSDAAFELEINRLLINIHEKEALQSERAVAAHGLESRSPFLDRQFVAVARSLPTDVLRMEHTATKTILRTAFSDAELLPTEILWWDDVPSSIPIWITDQHEEEWYHSLFLEAYPSA